MKGEISVFYARVGNARPVYVVGGRCFFRVKDILDWYEHKSTRKVEKKAVCAACYNARENGGGSIAYEVWPTTVSNYDVTP